MTAPDVGPVVLRDLGHHLDPEDHITAGAAIARTRHPLWLLRDWVITSHCGHHEIRRHP